MGQFKDMCESTEGTVTDDFGNTVVADELVGFHKRIVGDGVFV